MSIDTFGDAAANYTVLSLQEVQPLAGLHRSGQGSHRRPPPLTLESIGKTLEPVASFKASGSDRPVRNSSWRGSIYTAIYT